MRLKRLASRFYAGRRGKFIAVIARSAATKQPGFWGVALLGCFAPLAMTDRRERVTMREAEAKPT